MESQMNPASGAFRRIRTSVLEIAYEETAAQPAIRVPTVALHGEADGVGPLETSEAHGRHFVGPYERRVVPVAGHNLPQEAPDVVADAVLELLKRSE
jgi:pimeloyl-ACP methyl ester carboxylesterase